MKFSKKVPFASLCGKTFARITRTDATVTFNGEGGPSFRLEHQQDCCESVWLEDVTGDLADLVGSPIIMAEESTESDAGDGCEHTTWTYYKLGTAKGYVTLRWCGTSNGYYSEAVDLFELEGDRA